MTAAHGDGPATASGEPYRALLAVSEAIVSHRDLSALFHELAGRLHQVVRFDYLGLVLHEAASQTMRLHILEAREPTPRPWVEFPVGELPEGLVWQTQQPLILADVAEETRWPRFLEQVRPYGGRSACELPLTTARRRLGTLVLVSKQPSAYDAADVGFLQLVANQVALAVENALAFQEIAALRDQLSQEKAYLEEEVRTEHHFGEIIGESPALRRVLKQAETVAPTDSTVLIRGETGTGKELIARALHDFSPRRERTFVKLNCAAIPTGLWRASCSATRRAPSPAPSARRSAASSWRTRGPCSSTRSATSRRSCNPSCSACCRSRSSSGWAARGRSAWTSASWRPRTATSREWSPTAASAKTSTTA